MLALADASTGRLLRTLSLAGPTTAPALAAQLSVEPDQLGRLLEQATDLGVVHCDHGRFRADPIAIAVLVEQNRALLLGAAA
jgi:hypothetical protein